MASGGMLAGNPGAVNQGLLGGRQWCADWLWCLARQMGTSSMWVPYPMPIRHPSAPAQCRGEKYRSLHHAVHHREMGKWGKMGKDGGKWGQMGEETWVRTFIWVGFAISSSL